NKNPVADASFGMFTSTTNGNTAMEFSQAASSSDFAQNSMSATLSEDDSNSEKNKNNFEENLLTTTQTEYLRQPLQFIPSNTNVNTTISDLELSKAKEDDSLLSENNQLQLSSTGKVLTDGEKPSVVTALSLNVNATTLPNPSNVGNQFSQDLS